MKKFLATFLAITHACASHAVAVHPQGMNQVQERASTSKEISSSDFSLVADIETRLAQMPNSTSLLDAKAALESDFGKDIWQRLAIHPDIDAVKSVMNSAELGEEAQNLGELRSHFRSAGYTVAGDQFSGWIMLVALVPLVIGFLPPLLQRGWEENQRASAARTRVRDAQARAEEARAREIEAEAQRAELEAENARLKNDLQRMHNRAVGSEQ